MKVYLDSVGCRLNQSEIETYANQFRAAGHELVPSMKDAEMMVLNTCAVTAAASSDSRGKIRQAHRAGIGQIVVTGCMSTLSPDQTLEMKGVTNIIPNAKKDTLVTDLLQIEISDFDLEPISREPIPGSRMRTRAFIKAQDGCDNKCTFCVTTIARGEGRSRPAIDIISEINNAAQSGIQEAVLTGVHLGSWGQDLEIPLHLKNLIQEILKSTDIPRLRISSLEPWDLNADFFELWQDSRLCRHLHLPLQSGSAATLRRMARKVTPESYQTLIEAATTSIPEVAITTDIIVGFPGETDKEFLETKKFVEKMGFAGAHIFTYSEREGTAAALMPDQVHNFIRKERNRELREIVNKSSAQYMQQFIGKDVELLLEGIEANQNDSWELSGLTDNYLHVKTTSEQPMWNQLVPAQITKFENNILYGELTEIPNSVQIGG